MSDDRYQDQSFFIFVRKSTIEDHERREGEESKGEITRVDGIGRIENK